MTVNPIIPGKGNIPQVSGTQGQSGDDAFHDLTKSEGYDKGALEQATSERTRLTRARRAHKGSKKSTSLLLVGDDDELTEGEPIYRTVMVDGVMFTLRLLAVA